jgi:TPP-dependent pyruvate/acetoin dehydrogenase alpha subunit
VAAFEAIPAPGPEEIFRHVYGEITEPLSEQRAALMAHGEGKA